MITPLFKDLKFPGHPKDFFIKDFDYIKIGEGDSRLYYKVEDKDKRRGFLFYGTEFYSCQDYGEDPYQDSSLKVECSFWGWVYWDGLRHLYMGDKATDNENYLYCADSEVIENFFKALRGLECKFCNIDEIKSR